MAEPTIISWTPANWITVVIMVALAGFIVGAIVRTLAQRKAAA